MAESSPHGNLEIMDPSKSHPFTIPIKKIISEDDVQFFHQTYAYTSLMTFLLQLNASMYPRKVPNSHKVETWQINGSNIEYSKTVLNLRELIKSLAKIIDEATPDPGPRRFGNLSFRTWHRLVEERIDGLLFQFLPKVVVEFPAAGSRDDGDDDAVAERFSALEELKSYLMGSFGSAQRLDYGTGHELSFLAFLAGIWKLGGFELKEEGVEERAIVLGVIEPYLHLIRKLVLKYTLEPAGSHGVWGLDDHTFIPYIFGSAQYSPAISSVSNIPVEGSFPDVPKSGDVTKKTVVDRARTTNMYFSAVGFIYDVKKGPFWEHSPILFDISGVTKGWAKINKVSRYSFSGGMIKMYNAEVLSKFPVVQHFYFGSLFPWTRNPNAPIPVIQSQSSQQQFTSSNQTSRNPTQVSMSSSTHPPRPPAPDGGTRAPWALAPTANASASGNALPGPPWSWTGQSSAPVMPSTRAPWATGSTRPHLPPPGPGPGIGRDPGMGVGTSAPFTGATTRTIPSGAALPLVAGSSQMERVTQSPGARLTREELWLKNKKWVQKGDDDSDLRHG
ncbi:PTPA-domain-containing protein [Tothia fuscella]|uniref:Serine/threonine-protein phosphatase 2A activator n=1 Tax=Tothia fuscella TaxID=1048955 RepID=A0A9P4NPK6_9PEZI|nr:PTPA-domain-containing protein [Tothia fuscella]